MKNVIVLIVGFLIGGLLFSKCSSCGKVSSKAANGLVNYEDSASHYKSALGRQVSHNDALIMFLEEAYDMIDSLKPFLNDVGIKRPDVIIRTNTITRIDTLVVRFRDSLPCSTDFVLTDSVTQPGRYFLSFTLNKDSIRFNRIMIPNKQEIVVGEKKNGFLRRSSYEAIIVNSNPYITTTNIAALTLKPKPKFYDRLWFKGVVFGVGVFVGTKVR